MEVLYATSTGQGASLKDFAASNALITAESDAKQMHDKGLLITGNVSVERATVTKVDVERKVPNATVSSCLDISDWTVINGKTKKPAALPSERLTKYVVVSVVEKLPQGWRVIKDEPQAGQPC
ncbi:secreted protein/lipoprotein [Streptomyces arboris]|uniref:secreted protein/lipoprotein n=1 Tax=Streptomyces arboris TaxID=2600619 RepID=UPI003642ADAC